MTQLTRWSAPWSRPVRLGVAGLGGAVAALGQEPFGLAGLTLLGLLAVFLAAQKAGRAVPMAWTLWVAGSAYFGVTMHWIVEPFQVDAARHGWMAPFALVFLAGGLALFWALAGGIAGRARDPGRRVWVLALALSAAELARSFVFTGLPWGLIGGVWLDGPAGAWLSWIGPHGLGLLSLLIVAASAALMIRRPVMAVLPLALGPLLLIGTGMLQSPAPPVPSDAPIVRLVQPNAPQHLKWDPDWTGVFFARQLDMTRAAGTPDLIVWPETAIALRLPENRDALARITGAAAGSQVVLGLNRFEGRRIHNAAIVLDAEGTVAQVYDKARLVPFGEYVPFGDQLGQFGLYGLAARDGFGYSAGPGPALMDLGALGQALPLICYEAIFPGFGRALSRDASFMLHLTNDAWFGRFAGPQQHLHLARMRARERGLPMIRVANTGVSAIIDARGGVVRSLGLGETGFLDAPLPPRMAPTPYAQLGELPFAVLWICCAAAAFLRRRPPAN